MQLVSVATAVAATAAISASSKIAQAATEKPGQVGLVVVDVRDNSDGTAADVVQYVKDIKAKALFVFNKNHKKAKATIKAVKKHHSVGIKFPVSHEEDLQEMGEEKIKRKMQKLRKEIKRKHHVTAKYVIVPLMQDRVLANKVGTIAQELGMAAVASDKSLRKSKKYVKKSLKKVLKKPAENGLLLSVSAKSKHAEEILGQIKSSLAQFKKHARHRHSRANRKYFKLVKFAKAVKPVKGSKSVSESADKSKSSDETVEEVPLTRAATRVIVRRHKKYVGRDASKLVKKAPETPVVEADLPPKSMTEAQPEETAAQATNAGVRAGATMGSLLVAVVVAVFAML